MFVLLDVFCGDRASATWAKVVIGTHFNAGVATGSEAIENNHRQTRIEPIVAAKRT